MEDFVHLHVHTHYSILDGQSKVKYLVDKALKDGMKGMAITDHGAMFGIKEFADYCAKVNKARKAEGEEPFKPIFGCEMYVARRRKEDKVKEMHDNSGHHLVVLAKNMTGYKNLIKLVSRSWVDGYYYRPRTDKTDLERYSEGLIVCTACIAGEVPNKIIKGDIEGAREACLWYKRVFGDDFYLELQRHEVKDPRLIANREAFPLQQKANKVLLEFAKEYGIKYVCTNDCHFEDKETAEAHDHLLCLSTNEELNDPKRMRYSKQEWFKTQAEMNEVFGDLPEAMANTLDILNKVEFYDINSGPIMPFFPIPVDFGTEEEWRAKFSEADLYREFTTDENGENPLSAEDGQAVVDRLGGYEKMYRIKFEADYLAKLTYDGAKKLYGEPLSEEVVKSINFELHVMKTMGFPGYFLIVQDFISAARNELDVMVGPGRGSAAGSVVAYCLGITRIDPLKYDLLFERFLNPDRVNLPDIDTDFDDDGRSKVLQWVTNKYGEENCAHIITYSTMATKNSLKDVARVEGLPLATSNALCKAIPDRLPDGMKMNLANAIKCTPELQEAEVSNDPRERNTIKYAKMLEGTVRGTGIHACGFIICRDPISEWVPISTAVDPDFPEQKVPVTQYDGHVIETTGLIKMDFLGLKTLSEIKEAVKVIKDTTGDVIDIDNIPLDDPLTYELYQRGQTIGTFQFESAGMQKHLRDLKPTVFEDLIAMNALYRPGPMDYIPDFIKRKKDPSLVKYDIPCMEKYLKDTYGITVYQEQVMLLSRQLANFTRGESDALRKAMGKKIKSIVDAMKPKFIEQGSQNGHDPKILEKIWGDWEKFASYAFNKSHATCYSWVAYQTAYLKAHYPAEFMAALMTRRFSDITEITKLMEECKALKIKTLGPDVNESQIGFGVNNKGEIRFGLSAIKGIGANAAMAIVNERNANGPYKDIFDFAERVSLASVNRKVYESLAYSGGFDSFGLEREQFFTISAKGQLFIDTLLRYAQLFQQEKAQQQNSLFGGMDSVEIVHPPLPKLDKWPMVEKLNREKDLVGVYLSAHPLDEYDIVLRKMCNTQCGEISRDADLAKLAERKEVTFAGIVTESTERFSQKTGKPFGIVKIEDYDTTGELALFGDDWTRFSGMLKVNYHVFITAKCQPRYRNSDIMELKVSNVEHLFDVKERRLNRLIITIEAASLTEDTVADLAAILDAHPGDTHLHIDLRTIEGMRIELKSGRDGIKVEKKLTEFIESHPAMDYRIE
ncbi:MAG: DNA polymerase III subunit alpha [Prevotella sp.]|nr:DNA polymerase III subunit alpha [Prevotella sp.]